MSFAHPLWLAALVLPVTLAFLVWTKRGHRVVVPFDHGEQSSGAALGFTVNLAEMLPAVLLAIAIFLGAGPRKTSIPEEEREVTNVLFCLDVSGSMRGAMSGGARRSTRYDAAMSAIGDFTRYRDGDAFGLTAFGNEVWHWVPVTKDTSAIRFATPFLEPGKLPYWMSGTMIGKALQSCRDVLNRQEDGTAKKRRGRARGGWQVHYTPPDRRGATDGGYLSGEGLERFVHDAALAVGDVLTVERASARADNELRVTVVRAALGSAAKKPRGKSARRTKVLHK